MTKMRVFDVLSQNFFWGGGDPFGPPNLSFEGARPPPGPPDVRPAPLPHGRTPGGAGGCTCTPNDAFVGAK